MNGEADNSSQEAEKALEDAIRELLINGFGPIEVRLRDLEAKVAALERHGARLQ